LDPATRRLLIFTQFCFGVFPLLGKLAMESFTPRAVLVWRLLIGSGVLLLIAAVRHGRRAIPGASDLLRLFGLSVLGVIVNQLLFLEGLNRSTAVNAGLIMTIIPVATMGLAAMLGMERLTRRRVIGLSLSVAGVAILFGYELWRTGASLAGGTGFGDLLMTLNCISYSLYLVLAKPVLARVPQIVVVAWVFIFGALTVPWFVTDVAWMPADASSRQWLALGGVLLFPTVLAYLLNTIVLARTHASTTAAYIMLQPFVAASLGILILGERPGLATYITAVCVLAGLWLVSVPAHRAARRAI
jgi:drug/metabolite transporter (DMT)-like permease